MPSNVYTWLGLDAIALWQDEPEKALTNLQEALHQQPEYVKAVPDEPQAMPVSVHGIWP